MSASSVRGRIATITDVLGRFPMSIVQVLFRLAVASVFVKAGLTKIASWELTVQLFADEYKVPVVAPEIAARMAATFELGCSVLLIAGLATRLAVCRGRPLAVVRGLVRVPVARVAVKAALTKSASWGLSVQRFADEYKVPVVAPEIAARMAATFELGCSVLLIASRVARPAMRST